MFSKLQSRDRRPFVRIIRIYDSVRVPRYTVELLDIGSDDGHAQIDCTLLELCPRWKL
jgi:hypothetical protein